MCIEVTARSPVVSGGAVLRGWFLATVFASAFLLFMVQPMIARMALPRVGGAPSVWNSAMLVYQALLLAGYAYAHALGRLRPSLQALVHLALFALAALSLPIALLPGTPPPDANSYLWVPRLLLVSIGPLFFIVSAQAPLLQRWYALSGSGDPYPLYAASNFGSFLGLLAYPLVVEPLLAVGAQSAVWSAGFGVVGLLVAGCGTRLPTASRTTQPTPTAAPSRAVFAKWIILAAIPSGLIMATSLHLTTDIVAMPLLWVLPLGLYLLSFTVAFAPDRRAATLTAEIAPLALLIAACGVCTESTPLPLVMLAAALFAQFVISAALHAKLYAARPEAGQLTWFYLAMSVGGVLGGLFCALIAPMLFDWTYENPLLLIGAAALLIPKGSPTRRVWLLVGAMLLSLLCGIVGRQPWIFVGLGVALLVGLLNRERRLLFTAAIACAMLATGGFTLLRLSAESGRMTRSFFGIYQLRDQDGARMLIHGTTAHGLENLGSPQRERMATSYYAPRSGIGQAMQALPVLFPNARVGIVGLGAGTLACYSRPDQRWSFYEIDPAVVRIARDPARFRFLARCQPHARIIVGDARLMLEREPGSSADVLVIDAFSSDSVPMHLLTREAFDLYRRHLAKGGLLMVHISNRYLDFRPLLAATAAAGGWTARERFYVPNAAEQRDHAGASLWVALSVDPRTIARLEQASEPGAWRPLHDRGMAPWTDDFSTILPLIKWRG